MIICLELRYISTVIIIIIGPENNHCANSNKATDVLGI